MGKSGDVKRGVTIGVIASLIVFVLALAVPWRQAVPHEAQVATSEIKGAITLATPVESGAGRSVLAGQVPKAWSMPTFSNKPEYVPPTPGTYRLPPIQAAPEGSVLDTRGRLRPLQVYTHGKITLVGLIDSTCTTGCPIATHIMAKIYQALDAVPSLGKHVRFVTLSFNLQDTPEVMARYAASAIPRRQRGIVEWHFLTTASALELEPILAGFGQFVVRKQDGQPQHLLKVFLIDPRGAVRQIYAYGFFESQLVWADIVTLAMEDNLAQGGPEQ